MRLMQITHMTPAELDECPAVDLDWYLAVEGLLRKVAADREAEAAR